VAGSDLDVAQIHSSIEHGRHESVAQHMWMRSGDPYASRLGEPAQAPGGRMAVHPGAAGVEQDRPASARANCLVDGAADGWRQWDQDDLGAFAANAQYPVAVLFTQVGDVRAGGLIDPRAEKPSMATSAKSQLLPDWRAAASRASNCGWVNPRVGDSAGTEGRRTCSAGECSRRPSMTAVR